MLLSLLIGIVHCLMAAFNLGILAHFISDSVLAGFTSAAAVLICASQAKHLLGMHIPRGSLLAAGRHVAAHVSEVNLAALAIGVLGVGLLVGAKRLNRRLCPSVAVPEQLLLLVLATLGSSVFRLEDAGVAVVGEVPAGLPTPRGDLLGQWTGAMLVQLVRPALVVGLFSFLLSISIGRTFAQRYEYSVDANQELIALGVANILGSFFLAYPIAGSLSRSALVASASGADCSACRQHTQPACLRLAGGSLG